MNDKELQRQAKHRMAILRHADEVSGNVAATCRYYGISRTRFYRWRRRYHVERLTGLYKNMERGSSPWCSGVALSPVEAEAAKLGQTATSLRRAGVEPTTLL